MFSADASLHRSILQRADPPFLQDTIAAVLQMHLWETPNCLPPHLSLSRAIMHRSRWVYVAPFLTLCFFTVVLVWCSLFLGGRVFGWVWRLLPWDLTGWFRSGFRKPPELVSGVLRVRNRLHHRYAEELRHYRGDSAGAGRAHLRTGVLLTNL